MQYNMLKITFVLFSQTDGTRLYLYLQFLAISTVSQCPVAWSPGGIKSIPWLTDGLTDEWRFVDILVA